MPDTLGATGRYTNRGVPHGTTSITPYIGVPDTGTAVGFYENVFHARVVDTTEVDGAVIHAHLDFGNGHLHLERPDPEAGLSGPPSNGSAGFSLAF